jgi:predicted porin
MEGSRFGLRGTEDIGGGYKAIFTLENRFELDTGSVTNRATSGGQMPDRVQATSVAATVWCLSQALPLPRSNQA